MLKWTVFTVSVARSWKNITNRPSLAISILSAIASQTLDKCARRNSSYRMPGRNNACLRSDSAAHSLVVPASSLVPRLAST
jgi:hypothetical protein